MDKLGTTTQDATAVSADVAALDAGGDTVNGPEDLIDWDAINWHHQIAQVQRLRQRIFTAAQAGDDKQVRNLQKLMLRSRANTLFKRFRCCITGSAVRAVVRRLSISVWIRAGSASIPVLWSQTTVSR